jgi:hypothetical protein
MVILARADAMAKEEALFGRMKLRLLAQEMRRQENVEAIYQMSLEGPEPQEGSDAPMDQDWVNNFFEEAKDVSAPDMRRIFARILRGEAAQPGSFSRRTVAIVRELSPDAAKLFEQLCGLVWHDDRYSYVVHNRRDGHPLGAYGLTYEDMLVLDELGLIHAHSAGMEKPSGSLIHFSDRPHQIVEPFQAYRPPSVYPLSRAGRELAMALQAPPNELYYMDSMEMFLSADVVLAQVWPKQGAGA